MTNQTGGRRVVTNMGLSLDGHYAAPDDPLDMGWVMPYAVTDIARDHLTSLWKSAMTALLGRVNAEGFLSSGLPSPAWRVPTRATRHSRNGSSTQTR